MHASALVEALKRMLRARDVTYGQVAQVLGLSEASIKRMFARQDLTLQRLEQVCRAAGIEFDELVRTANED
jgi:DNA-binding Xre family transcriptional regulator